MLFVGFKYLGENMFRGFVAFFLISSVSISAYSKTCKILFQPLKLVEKAANSEEVVVREINPEFVELVASKNIIETTEQLIKLREMAAQHPFLHEAFNNIAQSHKYLEEIVNRDLRQGMRAVEMAYASGSSQVVMSAKQQKSLNKTNVDNKKVVSLAEAREKRIKEEKQEYETYLSQQYSEVNYGFFHQLYEFYVIIHSKVNTSTTVRLTESEYQTMKTVADNFKIYSNYLLAKDILQTFHKPPKDLTLELTAVLTRSPKVKNKFLKYLDYMDRALQEQSFEMVITTPAVERSQKQLLKEVKEAHLEGSEKRFAEAIHLLEGRIEY